MKQVEKPVKEGWEMSVLTTILAFGFIFFSFIIISLLVLPMKLSCEGEINKEVKGNISFVFLAGAVSLNLILTDNSILLKCFGLKKKMRMKFITHEQRADEEKGPETIETTETTRTIDKLQAWTKAIKYLDQELFMDGIYLLKSLWRIIKWERLAVIGRVGFDDPSITGIMMAFIHSLPKTQGTRVEVEPDFTETVCQGKCSFALQVRLVFLLKVVLSLIFRPGVRRFGRQALINLKQKKKREVENYGY